MKNEIFESFAVLFYIICLLVLAKKLICVLIQAACGTSQTMQEAVSIERELQLLNLKVPSHWRVAGFSRIRACLNSLI